MVCAQFRRPVEADVESQLYSPEIGIIVFIGGVVLVFEKQVLFFLALFSNEIN